MSDVFIKNRHLDTDRRPCEAQGEYGHVQIEKNKNNPVDTFSDFQTTHL